MRRFLLLLLMFLAFTFSGVVSAYAQSDLDFPPEGSNPYGSLQTRDENGNVIDCADMPEAQGGILIAKIMPCTLRTIQNSTQAFTWEMVDTFRPLLYTFLGIVISLFGIRVLQSEPDMHKHAILLLLKISLVITILDNLPDYFVPKAYEVLNEAVDVVTYAITPQNLHCDVENYRGGQTPEVWAIMDCIIGKLFGFSKDSSGTPNMVLATSLFGLLSGFFFGGAWGVAVFFAMLGVLISVFMLTVRTAMAFLNGYLTICILLIICPLLMPLVFMRSTQQYFEKVAMNILASFLMPVLVAAYAMMALMIYDRMLFADGSDGQPQSLVKDLFDYDQIQNALEKSKQACDRPITGDVKNIPAIGTTTPATAAQRNTLFKNPHIQNGTLSGAVNPCALAKVPAFNIDSVDNAEFSKGKETYMSLFKTLVTLLILGYLVKKGESEVSKIGPMITGGAMAATAVAMTSDYEQKIGASVQGLQSKLQRSLGNTSGADLLKKARSDETKQAFKNFLGGVRRK